MIKDLTNGRSASEIFREIMRSDESLTARDITRLIAEGFPKLDSAAIQFMRRWQGFGHRDNIQDAVLDMAVMQFLVDAGYVTNLERRYPVVDDERVSRSAKVYVWLALYTAFSASQFLIEQGPIRLYEAPNFSIAKQKTV